ncbi:MAG: amidase [Candidatus Latescibacteria bacterium]|nr:amidase [Candidatus Latescibacterota bacterium]
MTELWKLSAAEMAAGIRKGDCKASEVVAAVVARIEEQNPHLNAVTIDLTQQAVIDAEAADQAVAAGADLGPLHGVSLTIKENIDMAGQPNANGVPAFIDMMATQDAPLVRNLRRAGAIVVGRTNTPEFSLRATTDNPLRGRTYNPWGDQLSPGGSSGGAGAACAAGMAPLNHGNDIGGSLRFPAFANGLATVKPTTFRVPVFNSSAPLERGPLAQAMSVQGIIARHAADVRLATRAMIAPDPRDPNCPPVPWDGPDLGGRPKVAITIESNGYHMHPGIVELLGRAADQLREAGYTVVEIEAPPVAEAAAQWFRAGTTEMNATLGPAVQQYGSQTIKQIFEWYYELSELLDRDGYIAAFADRTRLMREWNVFLADYPLVLTPFLMRPLYDWNYDAQGFDQVKDLFDAAIYSTGINYLGLPAGVIGTGLVEGRPAAVQIVGQRYREDLICDAMEAIERRNGALVHRLWG